VKFSASCTDSLGQRGFDIHVNILKRCPELKVACDDIGFDFTKTFFDRIKLLLIQQSSIELCARVSDRSSDIMRK
jgi:hypothetical protein